MPVLLQLSDLHIAADPAYRAGSVDPRASLRAILKEMVRPIKPDLLLLSGDLSHDGSGESYAWLAGQLADLPCEILCLPGNHDRPQGLGTLAKLPRVSVMASKWIGDRRLLPVDSCVPNQTSGNIDERELARIESILDDHGDQPVILALHHHPIAIGSPWMDRLGLDNGEELQALIQRHPNIEAVIFGHIHQTFEKTQAGAAYLGCPSTCSQFPPGAETFTLDHQPPGGRLFTLHADSPLQSRILRLDRTPSAKEPPRRTQRAPRTPSP